MTEHLWFTVLGPVRAWRGPDEVDLGSPQQRAALGALLLREGAQASVDELVDAIWDDRPPRSAGKAVRTYVYRLRKALDADVIETVGNGYALRVSADECDLASFREELARAESARQAGDLAAAAGLLRSALTLWQGSPLAGVQGRFADAQRARLAQLYRSALEARLTIDVELGDVGAAVGELTALVADQPLDERFRELLMLALSRSGRQADALAVYGQGRSVLAEELGIDPGPGLRAAHERILRGEPDRVEAPVPAQLPADPAHFTGREAELGRLTALLPGGSRSLVTVVIAGMAGWARRRWPCTGRNRWPRGSRTASCT